MALSFFGLLILSIASIVGTYLVIRQAVRDGINTSAAVDWKTAYLREQKKFKLPSLNQLYSEAGAITQTQNIPVNQRKTEIERIVQERASELLRQQRNQRFIITIVGVIIALLLGSIFIVSGMNSIINERDSSYYSYNYSYFG